MSIKKTDIFTEKNTFVRFAGFALGINFVFLHEQFDFNCRGRIRQKNHSFYVSETYFSSQKAHNMKIPPQIQAFRTCAFFHQFPSAPLSLILPWQSPVPAQYRQ